MHQDRRDLKSGGSATGLLIVDVTKGSPAANAGLAAVRETPKEILSTIVVFASMAFPPAILLLPIEDLLPNGAGGDLIIAADGSRVRSYLEAFYHDSRMIWPLGGQSASCCCWGRIPSALDLERFFVVKREAGLK